MYDTILVPTDGSPPAARAADHAAYLAKLFDATLHVVNVIDVRAAAGLFDAGGVDEQFIAQLEAKGQTTIADIEERLDHSLSIETAVLDGTPAKAILEYVSDNDVEMVAMGTHGRTGLNRYMTGSVTERVVRRADVPVLTVRDTERSRLDGDYDEILIPTDGSDYAAVAVDHGLAIAERADARIHAVYVVDVGTVPAGPEAPPPAGVIDHVERIGEDAIEAIESEARDRGLAATTAMEDGSPAKALLAYADDHAIDLVTMGTAGRTGLSEYLVGSTTERVIRRAPMPVIAVHPPSM